MIQMRRFRALALIILALTLIVSSAMSRAGDFNMQMVGSLGGYTSQIKIQGGYAYLGSQYHLTILDISNPAAPTVAKIMRLPKPFGSMDVVGNKIYMLTSSEITTAGVAVTQFMVIDVADPANAAILHTESITDPYISFGHILVSGNQVFIFGQDTADFRAYDIDSGFNLTLRRGYSSPRVNDAEKGGQKIYAATGSSVLIPLSPGAQLSSWSGDGMMVLDIATETTTTYASPFMATSVAVSGPLGAVSGGRTIHVLNLPAGAAPTFITSCTLPALINDLAFDGTKLYSVTDSGLYALDLSNPSSPVQYGPMPLNGTMAAVNPADHTVWAGAGDGVHAIDPADLSHPVLKGSYTQPYKTCLKVLSAGIYSYVFQDRHLLSVIDVSDPNAPIEVGRETTGFDSSYAEDAALNGRYIYATNGADLRIYDVNKPTTPVLARKFEPMPGYPKSVAASGTRLFAACENYGLRIYDVTVPTSPTLKTIYDTGYNELSVRVWGNLAFVNTYASTGNRIVILDTTNLNHITQLGVISPGGLCAIGWPYLFVLGDYKLAAYDISNPSQPRLLGNAYAKGSGMHLDGRYVYVADQHDGTAAYDVSDAGNPVLIGRIYTCSSRDVAGENGIAYIADQEGGVVFAKVLAGYNAAGRWTAYK